MPKDTDISDEFIKKIRQVTNKRARFVLDTIVEKGFITTEELNAAGYDHPPRAARDVRELGFPLVTGSAKHSVTGKTIASYSLGKEGLTSGKSGRSAMPKKIRDSIIAQHNGLCQLCKANHNLQVDHCIPYEVAGETEIAGVPQFQVLCGSCNRKKSWDCEHCQNWIKEKNPNVCASCYWANPNSYLHVAMHQQRRSDITWDGNEVAEYDRLRKTAAQNKITVQELIKRLIRNNLSKQ